MPAAATPVTSTTLTKMVLCVLLVSCVDAAVARRRQLGPYGHSNYNNNNNNNNNNQYSITNNNNNPNQPHTIHHNSQPPHNHAQTDFSNRRGHYHRYHHPDHYNSNPYYHYSDNHNPYNHHSSNNRHHHRHLEATGTEGNMRNHERLLHKGEDAGFWDWILGLDSRDLEDVPSDDLTHLQHLSKKFGIYDLLPDPLKMTRGDLEGSASSYTSYMQEVNHNPKSFPGIDFYSLFAFFLFASSLTYTIFFLTKKGGEEEEERGMEGLGGASISKLQEDLLRVVTEALERWKSEEEEEE